MIRRTMGTITQAVTVNAPADLAWGSIADIGQLHIKVAPGMVTDTVLEENGAARVVTFFNGAVLREQIISNDAEDMRLAWTASGGPWTHHNAALQVIRTGNTCEVIWIADVLPFEAAKVVAEFVKAGLAAFKVHLEASADANN